MMKNNKKNEQNKCLAHQSLPNILIVSNRILPLRRSQSLPSCLKFTSTPMMKEKRSNPTIGDLLGDDDRFHHRYYHHFNPWKSKRKRYSHHERRKHRHSTTSKSMPISPDIHQYYPYSNVYNYSPHPNYSYYYWSTIPSCWICDYYRGFYSTESTMASFLY